MREVVVDYFGKKNHFMVNRYPDECGICNTNVDPKFIAGAFVRPSRNSKDNLELVFQCTNIECNSLMIGYYRLIEDTYVYTKTQPINPKNKMFQEEINEVSPNLVEIYNQAFQAEQLGFNLISGIGYRKSLEFLVKDYLIYLRPEEEEAILNQQLTPCINMLENHTIKEIAEKSIVVRK